MKKDILNDLSWEDIGESLGEKGYAVIPKFLDPVICETLRAFYENDDLFRKTVIMERHSFGKGAYKYLKHPLPAMIDNLRNDLYTGLVPIANKWMQQLGMDNHYPVSHAVFLRKCQQYDQNLATPLILKYHIGGYNTLHQDLYGDIYFPFQAVVLLSQPGDDFEGGEFVLTEQKIRAQSKAIVLSPGIGDIIIFATNFRPVRGKTAYYRARMRHGVSEVKSGQRMTLGIIFHDAKT